MLNRSFLVGCGVGGGDAHKYWRITNFSTVLPDGLSCAKLELRASVGGADQCSGGTASASAQFSGTYSADKAFDASTTTSWFVYASANFALEWLKYAFTIAVSVAEIVYSVGGTFYTSQPVSFDLEWSDDDLFWTKHATINCGTWAGTNPETKTFGV